MVAAMAVGAVAIVQSFQTDDGTLVLDGTGDWLRFLSQFAAALGVQAFIFGVLPALIRSEIRYRR